MKKHRNSKPLHHFAGKRLTKAEQTFIKGGDDGSTPPAGGGGDIGGDDDPIGG